VPVAVLVVGAGVPTPVLVALCGLMWCATAAAVASRDSVLLVLGISGGRGATPRAD
jgi:hypothetical protein